MTSLGLLSSVLSSLAMTCGSALASTITQTGPDPDTLFTLSTLVQPTAKDCSTPVWEERGTYASAREIAIPAAPGLYRLDAKVYTDEGDFVRIEEEFSEYYGSFEPSESLQPQAVVRATEAWHGPGCQSEFAWVRNSTVHVADNAAQVAVYDSASKLLSRASGKSEHNCGGLPSGVYVVTIAKDNRTCAIVMPILSD